MATGGKDIWSNAAQAWTDNGLMAALALVEAVHKVAPLSSVGDVLDVGSGNGAVFKELFRAYGSQLNSSSKFVAVDLSPAMIEQLVEHQKSQVAAGNALWSRVESKVLDAGDLEGLQDSSFGHVFCSNSLYAVSDYTKVLSEVKRVLAPGGTFGYCVNTKYPWVSLMHLLTKVHPDRKIPNPAAIWASEESCKKILEDAGFRDVEASLAENSMNWDSYQGVVDGLIDWLPFMPRMLAGLSEEEVQTVKAFMVEHLKENYPTLPTKFVGETCIVVGKK